jgi:hypothetical protein
MSLKPGAIEEFTFSDSDNVASACSAALRKVKSLSDIMPAGRLFAAIATLDDAAEDIGEALQIGALRTAAKRMKDYAAPLVVASLDEPLPIHFRKRS